MRGYRWIFVLVALATLAVGVRFVWMVQESRSNPRIGDGQFPSTYGFDLTNLSFPREQLSASPLPKDGLEAIVSPELYSATKASSFKGREKYLVPTDLVVGVWENGAARAYPIQVLNWHEVVNDTLGGTPIVVSYSPLAGVGAAYDRRVGSTSLAPFGLSGLLWNSHHLLFDRQSDVNNESLWSPLTGRAVAGPAVGTELRSLSASLVPWSLWVKHHPETTVLARDEMLLKKYKRRPYVAYFGNDELRFPVTPLPQRSERPWKTPVLVPIVGTSPHTALVPPSALPGGERRDGASETETPESGSPKPSEVASARFELAGQELRIEYSLDPLGALAFDAATSIPVPSRSAFWFAWYSVNPGSPIR